MCIKVQTEIQRGIKSKILWGNTDRNTKRNRIRNTLHTDRNTKNQNMYIEREKLKQKQKYDKGAKHWKFRGL